MCHCQLFPYYDDTLLCYVTYSARVCGCLYARAESRVCTITRTGTLQCATCIESLLANMTHMKRTGTERKRKAAGERALRAKMRVRGYDEGEAVRARLPLRCVPIYLLDMFLIIAKAFGKQSSLSPEVTRREDHHDKRQNDEYPEVHVCATNERVSEFFLIKFRLLFPTIQTQEIYGGIYSKNRQRSILCFTWSF